jgi:hypothetical protein
MLNQTVQGSIIQRRMIDKKLYKVFGALWDINDLRRDYDSAFPLCDNCRIALKGETIDFSKIESTYVCPKCGKKFEFLEHRGEYFSDLQRDAFENYQSSLRQDYDVITLDTPPAKVKVKDEDEYYVLWANMTQQKGKRLGLVYMAEKGGKDKVQLFIDLDSQQVRHDPANKHPKELLAKVTVEFNDGTEILYKYKKEE